MFKIYFTGGTYVKVKELPSGGIEAYRWIKSRREFAKKAYFNYKNNFKDMIALTDDEIKAMEA